MNISDIQSGDLLAQESKLQFSSFSFADGVNIGLDLLKRAREDDLPIVIDVYAYGQQLFHAAMPHTRADNGEWVARKRCSVLRFAHSSLYLGASCREAGVEMEDKYFLPPRVYSSHGGSFPILLRDGGVIGAITVSGLAQQDDHALVVATLESYLAK